MCCNEEHGHHPGRHHGGHECGCGDKHDRDCCCEKEHHHRRGYGCSCCCEGNLRQHFHRHFHTREERLAWLEAYLQDLQAEVKAVEEHIAGLQAAQADGTTQQGND